MDVVSNSFDDRFEADDVYSSVAIAQKKIGEITSPAKLIVLMGVSE